MNTDISYCNGKNCPRRTHCKRWVEPYLDVLIRTGEEVRVRMADFDSDPVHCTAYISKIKRCEGCNKTLSAGPATRCDKCKKAKKEKKQDE